MIEITIKMVDGVEFIDKVRVLEPDLKWHGVGVHKVDPVWADKFGGHLRLRALGLRRVNYDLQYHSYYYTATIPAILSIGVEYLFHIYWACIRWLYDNARMFKAIPAEECFSWRYLTPYQWIVGLWKKLKSKSGD